MSSPDDEFKSPFADDAGPAKPDDTMMLTDGLAADAPPIPDVEIQFEIGRGGMGVVYRGRQSYLSRDVAVKVLDNQKQGPEFARRFQREATILASLSHQNIVACHHAGVTEDGRCFLVMEYIDGPDLLERLEQDGALGTDEALRITGDLAKALGYAQGKGVIHRDVKPANVLLQRKADGGYTTKLVDLGLARPEERTEATVMDITVAGAVMGSPATMAPEQFDDPDRVDHRADIYGLGCVLFHSLTGRVAYPQKTLTETIAQKMRDACPDPRDLRKDLPTDLAALIRKMLAKRPEDRPQSYDEVLREVERLRTAKPGNGTSGGGALPWVAAGVLVLGAGGVGAWALGLGPFADDGPSEAELARQAQLEQQAQLERQAQLAEQERLDREEAERLAREEQARKDREAEAARLEREAELERQREEEARLAQEEADRLRREEEARLAREEAARVAALERERLEREALTPALAAGESRALFSDDHTFPLKAPWRMAEGDVACVSINTESSDLPVMVSPSNGDPFAAVAAERPLPRGPWILEGAFRLEGPRSTFDKTASVVLGFAGDVRLTLAMVRPKRGDGVTFEVAIEGEGAPDVREALALEPRALAKPSDAADFHVAVRVEALEDGAVRVAWGLEGEPAREAVVPAEVVGERGAPTWVRLATRYCKSTFRDFRLRRDD